MIYYKGAISFKDLEEMSVDRILDFASQAVTINKEIERQIK